MKIVSLFAENLKRLSVVQITPAGALVQITGANGSGKSSVLDAIYWALAGKKAVESQPVRQGEETATVKLDLGDVIVTRKFSADGTTSVTVEAASGARFPSPQAVLDGLLGSLTFDPLAFSRMDATGQSDTLRQLVTLAVDVPALDRENAGDYEKRRDFNRSIAALKPRVEALKAAVPATVPERVDVAQLVDELRRSTDANTANERRRERYRHDSVLVGRLIAEAQRLEAEALAKRNEATTLRESLVRQQDELGDDVDTTELAAKIDAAQDTNRAADQYDRTRAEYSKLAGELADLTLQSEACTTRMDDRSQTKRAALVAAKMPIDGLSFGENFEVLYRGLPFEQGSSAEQLRVSVAIAMATNPRLRVLRIKDGSLLDESNLALLAAMAEAGDYQCWIERVETSGRVGVVMVDGAVASVNT